MDGPLVMIAPPVANAPLWVQQTDDPHWTLKMVVLMQYWAVCSAQQGHPQIGPA